MRGIKLDVVNQTFETIECESNLQAWYDLLNCDMVEMPERQIGGKYYTIICDEEGLLKQGATISAVSPTGNAMMVGNLLIFNTDLENADIADLTDDDIANIEKHIRTMSFINNRTGEIKDLVVVEVEY